MSTNQPSALEIRQYNAAQREKLRRMFSSDPVVKLEAEQILKAAWGYTDPSFDMGELATMPTEACTIMAAKRDAYKEVVDWLLKV